MNFVRTFTRTALGIPAWPALCLLGVTAWLFQPRLLGVPFLLIVLRQTVPLALAALGQSFPMIGRSIDVSMGGVIALVNVTLALPALAASVSLSLSAALVIGVTVGLVNAVLIAYVRASAVVVTLGMAVLLTGISYLISGGAPGGAVHPDIKWIATSRVHLFPLAGTVLLVFALASVFVLRKTVLGHTLYATGANYEAARLGGLAVQQSLLAAHVFSAVYAAAAGVVLTGYIGTGTLNLGAELVMASVAAVVLGGMTFGGGAGGVLSIIAGAYALSFLANLMTSIGLGKPAQLIVQGAIIASAAALARWRERRS